MGFSIFWGSMNLFQKPNKHDLRELSSNRKFKFFQKVIDWAYRKLVKNPTNQDTEFIWQLNGLVNRPEIIKWGLFICHQVADQAKKFQL